MSVMRDADDVARRELSAIAPTGPVDALEEVVPGRRPGALEALKY